MSKTSNSTSDSGNSADGGKVPNDGPSGGPVDGGSAPTTDGGSVTPGDGTFNDTANQKTEDRAVDQGPVSDPTDGFDPRVGDAAVQTGGGERDMSDPQQNANVGFSAEGAVVSNQQGEQVNTVQASEGERAEVMEMVASENRDPFTDPSVTNPSDPATIEESDNRRSDSPE